MLESDAILETAARLQAEGKPFALVTVVRCESPTSARPGAKALVEADGSIQGWIGGGCAQPAVIKTAKQALLDGQPRLIRISPNKDDATAEGIVDFGMTCHSGGTLDIFIDPVSVRPGLLIIGTSPAAQSLAALASRVGFAVTAAFPAASAELFPDAQRIIDGLEISAIQSPSFVVVATQGKKDEQGLEAALATGATYIAFIASARKAQKLKQYLLERGHDRARVEAIIAPAGVEIDAVTPEEIALSVLGGVVQARRGGGLVTASSAAKIRIDKSPVRAPEIKSAQGPAIDPVCGMSVDAGSAEYKTEHAGKTYYFCCAGCQHAFEKTPQRYLAEKAS